jgi:16S rRNA (guanine527-N7)-methyltransferase
MTEHAPSGRDRPDSSAGSHHREFPQLSQFAERFGLAHEQLDKLRRFGVMLAWDERAPTTVRDPARVRDDHLADALVALRLPAVRSASVLADLGSGAGVPGLPLAIALPGARVVLVEGNGRKCEFMRGAAAELGLENVEVVQGRAETWRAGIGRMDLVTARALASLDVVAEYAAPLLRLGGALVAWRGQREPGAESDALRAAEVLGLTVAEPVRVEPYPGAINRHLHVMTKASPTPERFPRRDGVARKRPLGRA